LAVEGPLFRRLEGVFPVAGVDVQLRRLPGGFGAEMKTLSRVVALEPPGGGNAFAPVAGKGLGEIA
jgi:hypothetical protein